MKNILLFGGTGFIGKNIIESYLSNPEVNLIVISRNSKEIENIYSSFKNIIIISRSFSDFDFISKTITNYNIDVIIHLISGIIPSSSNQEFYNEIDNVILPTFKLIDFIADKNIKFVYFSSGGTIYGNIQDLIRESTNLDPINNYGYSKLLIENYIQLISKRTKLNYLILRPSNVYGKHQVFDSNQGFISVAISKAYNNIPIDIWGDGNAVRDYIDVYDVALILQKLLNCFSSNLILNISTGIGFSLLEIISIIENNLHKNVTVNFKVKRIVDASTVILDNSNLLRIIDHNFIDVSTGIKNQISYFKIVTKNAI